MTAEIGTYAFEYFHILFTTQTSQIYSSRCHWLAYSHRTSSSQISVEIQLKDCQSIRF